MIIPKYPLITSQQNPIFKDLQAALEGESESVLVHGLKVARDLIGKGFRPKTLVLRESFSLEKSKSAAELVLTRFENPVSRVVLNDALFDQVDPFGVPDMIVAMERPKIPMWDPKKSASALIVATQNPANLGACLRSAAAFGVKNVICLKEAASPYHPRTVRGSMGLVFDLNITKGPSIRELAKTLAENPELTKRLVALDMDGTELSKFKWPKDALILIGEEGAGVPESFAGERVRIPMQSGVESLNAAVSAGIALYDWSVKNGKQG